MASARSSPRRHRGGSAPAREAPADREPVYGLRAALAVFARRRDQITAILHGSALPEEAAPLLSWAKASRVRVAEIDASALARHAGTHNHEDILLETRRREFLSPSDLEQALREKRGAAIALDRVRNPYNVGAILRTAAFFGIDGVLFGATAPSPTLAPDAVRVAEGGVEHLLLAHTTDLAATLARFRSSGIRVLGASGDGEPDALGRAFRRPAVLVLGHEREGLSPRVRATCDTIVSIRGTGAIESLNVAVAAGLLIERLGRIPEAGQDR